MKLQSPERVTDDALFAVVLDIRSNVINPIQDLTTIQKFQGAIEAERKSNTKNTSRLLDVISDLNKQLAHDEKRLDKLQTVILESIDCPHIFAEEDIEIENGGDILMFSVGSGEGLTLREAIDDAISHATREIINDQEQKLIGNSN